MKNLHTGLLLMGVVCSSMAGAQGYPNKPVRIIVAYPAGGSNDIVARSVGQKFNELLGVFIKSEIQKFAKLAKLAGVKPE